MSTSSVNRYPKLLDVMNQVGVEFSNFFLVDVGVSGGIDEFWLTFGNKLKAVGFDPLVSEVERLNESNENTNISYVDGFVVSGLEKADLKQKNAEICTRGYAESSSVLAQKIKKYNYVQEKFNAGAEIQYSENHFSLDSYFSNEKERVDFIKIDTDGHDIDVLFGAEKLLDQGVLGLSVEMQFHGLPSLESNTFSAIDIFLRKKGFRLFDLDVFRYAKKDLPTPFLYDIHAQTKTGQVIWGEAVYFRDLGDDAVYEGLRNILTRDDILKQVFLFELFGLSDCAAEIINKRFKDFDLEGKKEIFLDTLAANLPEMAELTYEAYMKKFLNAPDSFFPSKRLVPSSKRDFFKRLRRCASILLGRS
jgi:FkbM family methyltransferase